VVLNQSLTKVARELVVCRSFVGHDSGITHLAAALGLPSIVLWAQTNERVWCPLGEGVQVLKDPSGLETIQPQRVIDFLKKVSPIH